MISDIFSLVLSVGAVLLLFGGTVFIHELGHFLSAKKFGLRIDAFAVGMGPALWQKEIGGVVYKLCALPIGGYVALPQMDITGSAFENEDAKAGILEPVAPWKRIVIAVAGPAMNVIGAFILCLIVWQAGRPTDDGAGPPIIAEVEEGSSADKVGLRGGDEIVAVNGDEINFWADFRIATMLNKEVELKILRDGELHYIRNIETEPGFLDFLEIPGLYPEGEKVEFVNVGSVIPDSPADKAGLKEGDTLISIDGKPIDQARNLKRQVKASGGSAVSLEVKRSGEIKSLSMQSDWAVFIKRAPKGSVAEKAGLKHSDRILSYNGIELAGPDNTAQLEAALKEGPLELKVRREDEELTAVVQPGSINLVNYYIIGILMNEMTYPKPLTQIRYFQGSIFRTLKAFSRPREARRAAEGVGGPVMILGGMHDQVKYHPMQALWFTALINVNLAIINLMPLIILDGGHIMIALFEWVTGKKPHRGLIIGMANTMVAILIVLMVALSIKDFGLRGKIKKEIEAAASATATPTPEAAPENSVTPEPDIE